MIQFMCPTCHSSELGNVIFYAGNHQPASFCPKCQKSVIPDILQNVKTFEGSPLTEKITIERTQFCRFNRIEESAKRLSAAIDRRMDSGASEQQIWEMFQAHAELQRNLNSTQ